MNPVAEVMYRNMIEDLSDAISHRGAQQVLDDLKILNLTNYEELAKIVMRTDAIKKKTAVLLKDPYFDANQD